METGKIESEAEVNPWGEFAEKGSEVPEFDPEKAERMANLVKFTRFLERDLSVKKGMVEVGPRDEDNYNEEARIEYADRFYEGMRGMKADLKMMMKDYYPSETLETKLQEITEDIIKAGVNYRKLGKVYQRDITDMRPEFVDKVHEEAVGYYLSKDLHKLDERAQTVNEILHLVHSAVMNDEEVLESLPVIEKKVNDYGMGAVLYGDEEAKNETAAEIYHGLTAEVGDRTDVVALKDRTLMMVRDRGHATTIDVQKWIDGKMYVGYFIPKICNVEMVNALPGVNKVRTVRETTTGIFEVEDESKTAERVLDLISGIPTDADMGR